MNSGSKHYSQKYVAIDIYTLKNIKFYSVNLESLRWKSLLAVVWKDKIFCVTNFGSFRHSKEHHFLSNLISFRNIILLIICWCDYNNYIFTVNLRPIILFHVEIVSTAY